MRTVFLLWAAVFVLVSCNTSAQNGAGVQNINAKQMESMMTQKNVVVVDVRTDDEVRQGYISETDYFIDIYKPGFDSEIDKLDKEKTYIIYCRSGARSSSAASKMTAKGFKKVYNLSGGINSWTNRSFIKTK
jgi:rhodanese-related sulfurtransferase